jgi:transposase
MGRAYSLDLWERVLKDCDDGMSREDAARKYSISIQHCVVDSLRKRRRATGSLASKNCWRGQSLKLAPYENEVRQLIAEHPDATLEELPAKLPDEVPVTVSTLHNFFEVQENPLEKTLYAAEHHRGDVAEQREAWKKL